MNDESPGSAADGVEEGKRLIRTGGDRGLSLAERISERFQRLTWGTPLHAMRLRGRHPLKLIAIPDDPFFGEATRGNALLEGKIRFRGEERAIDSLDFANPDWSPALGDHLQSFAWLRDLSSVATRARGVPIAEEIMRRWIVAHGEKVSEPAWRADIWGRRILFWTAHAPLILSSTDLVYRSSVLHALARGARHLDRGADRVHPGNALIAAWSGVLVAGLAMPGGDPRRAYGENGLKRALEQSVFEDGGSVTRSPVAQIESIQFLTLVGEAYAARRLEAPGFVEATRNRMVTALLGLCHGDKGLSSWQGSGPIDGEIVAQLVEATGVRTRPLKQAREWGYQRLSQGQSVLIMDAAPPPLARLVEGGCASTLAFELSDGPDRIVVNCGGARAALAKVPTALVEGLRTTAAHSTLVLSNSNSTAIHADGTLGRGVVEVELARHETDTASRIEASHDGYVRRHGYLHRRVVAMSPDGRDVRGEDMLLPADRRKHKTPSVFVIRFHLHPQIEVTPTADGLAAILRTASGHLWQFRCKGGSLAIEDSVWVDARGRPLASQQLVATGATPAGGANVSWLFHRAR
ncbi:putative heparinase superfamily protein [Sphingomonas naasensis]|uniref:Heparinase n=1 Tax=Sphingomonas naasensis TaxID=1344951 RepID=A0A4S1WBD0_9SPHN|nr:heparinase II/III family protein [Sphingomonas naasensis]NIJ21336.1 putative heparinase superfamily protein [Sphingomonas naasensis]TGX38767.1 heparinase [Sphingomonas naasensis]